MNLNQSVGVSGVERRWSQTSTSGLIYQPTDGRFVTSPPRHHHHLSIRRVKSFFLPSFAGAGGVLGGSNGGKVTGSGLARKVWPRCPIFQRELPVIVDLCLGENEFGKCSSHAGAWRVEG